MPAALMFIMFLLMRFVFLLGYVPSASMEPTLQEGSYILAMRLYQSLEVGDIIIFRHDGELMVKRIAAAPGETVNWSQLTYAEGINIPERAGSEETVPECCYLVLGDNVMDSYDSRYWKDPYVKAEDIVGKLIP